jgi:hypothetical protein
MLVLLLPLHVRKRSVRVYTYLFLWPFRYQHQELMPFGKPHDTSLSSAQLMEEGCSDFLFMSPCNTVSVCQSVVQYVCRRLSSSYVKMTGTTGWLSLRQFLPPQLFLQTSQHSTAQIPFYTWPAHSDFALLTLPPCGFCSSNLLKSLILHYQYTLYIYHSV